MRVSLRRNRDGHDSRFAKCGRLRIYQRRTLSAGAATLATFGTQVLGMVAGANALAVGLDVGTYASRLRDGGTTPIHQLRDPLRVPRIDLRPGTALSCAALSCDTSMSYSRA